MAPKRDELPVVAQAYRLASDLLPVIERMPRGLRSVLGGEILREAVSLSACLQEAALHRGRLGALGRADIHLTRLRVLVRLAFDQKAVSPAAYGAAGERADEVGKMLGGWLRRAKSVGAPSGAPAGLAGRNSSPTAACGAAPSTTTATT